MKFVVFRESNQLWYWQLRTRDGEVVAGNPVGSQSKEKVFTEIQKIRSTAPNALVFDLLGNLFEGI